MNLNELIPVDQTDEENENSIDCSICRHPSPADVATFLT
jgi:hypothetical protein